MTPFAADPSPYRCPVCGRLYPAPELDGVMRLCRCPRRDVEPVEVREGVL